MARDSDGIIKVKYANAGDVGLDGLDLDELWPIAFSTPGGPFPQRIVFNQLFRWLSALGVEINSNGPFLEWDGDDPDGPDYEIGAGVTGSDGIRYTCRIANGPSSSIVNPVGDVTGTWDNNLSDIGTIDLTGGQIAFPATAVPSSDPNTLDDYEEGTFTFTLDCSVSGDYTIDPAQNTGSYTKIGDIVHVQGSAAITSENSPNGFLQLSLPFTSKSLTEEADNLTMGAVIQDHGGTLPTISGFLTGGLDFLRFYSTTDSGVGTVIAESEVDTAFQIRIGGTYKA